MITSMSVVIPPSVVMYVCELYGGILHTLNTHMHVQKYVAGQL